MFMINLAIIYHMHQPYYKDLLSKEIRLPWVRLHGIKDYLDMLLALRDFPQMRLTFNLVPCLIEQIEDYAQNKIQDTYLKLSYKPAEELTEQEQQFILANFFCINPEYGIAVHPRYYQLYLKRNSQEKFSVQDLRDLQVWVNLAWFDPYFRKEIPELKSLVAKARFFSEEEKCACLNKQFEVLEKIIPAYKEFQDSGQIEITTSPYYHPILPLLCNNKIAKQANYRVKLPQDAFIYPQDAASQIEAAIEFHREKFACSPKGLWPSEQAVSEHILELFIHQGINWIVTDEAMLFRSIKKKRAGNFLYKPYCLKRNGGALNIIFRDRYLSDLIGFDYHRRKAEDAVENFLGHLKNISRSVNIEHPLVVVALDGENAWEYFRNDGWDFLTLLYARLSEADYVKTTTISQYLEKFPAQVNIRYLQPGSWVNGNFDKWLGAAAKNRAWEQLSRARAELAQITVSAPPSAGESGQQANSLAWKQIHICEGSDWFWWYADTDDPTFDQLFRMHLSNFYRIIGKPDPFAMPAQIKGT